jgi:AcrR family transcriptional regulator
MNINSLIEDLLTKERPAGSVNRKERDRRLRKADILRAAEHLFALKGYHDATMQDIAREAQYATGTVYLYFKDKDELYFSLFEEKLKSFFLIVKERTSQIEDAKKKLEIFIQVNLAFFEKNQDFFRIFVSERTNFQAVKDAKFSRSVVLSQHREYVAELIKLGQEQKMIRSDFHPRQIAEIFTSIFLTVVFHWLKEGARESKNLSGLSDFILDMFLNGAGIGKKK